MLQIMTNKLLVLKQFAKTLRINAKLSTLTYSLIPRYSPTLIVINVFSSGSYNYLAMLRIRAVPAMQVRIETVQDQPVAVVNNSQNILTAYYKDVNMGRMLE